MTMIHDIAHHPAPHRGRVNFWVLLFGDCAAPLFWLGQLTLSYSVSAYACYGSDHPTTIKTAETLRAILFGFDALAIVMAFAGGVVSVLCWRAVRGEKEGGQDLAIEIGDGRARFMAMWGILSSLWFFGAILFTSIASAMVPLCVQ